MFYDGLDENYNFPGEIIWWMQEANIIIRSEHLESMVSDWYLYHERGALIDFAFNCDHTAMFIYDSLYNA